LKNELKVAPEPIWRAYVSKFPWDGDGGMPSDPLKASM